MPAMINAHVHIGYEKYTSWGAQNYTPENVLDHLQREAFYGTAATQSVGSIATARINARIIDGLRELPDGRVLVNDLRRRQLVVFDSSLATFTVLADSAGQSGAKYPAHGCHFLDGPGPDASPAARARIRPLPSASPLDGRAGPCYNRRNRHARCWGGPHADIRPEPTR